MYLDKQFFFIMMNELLSNHIIFGSKNWPSSSSVKQTTINNVALFIHVLRKCGSIFFVGSPSSSDFLFTLIAQINLKQPLQSFSSYFFNTMQNLSRKKKPILSNLNITF